MNVAELRGYVRTRRVPSMPRASAQFARRACACRRTIEASLTAAVLERAVHLVIRDLFVQPDRCRSRRRTCELRSRRLIASIARHSRFETD